MNKDKKILLSIVGIFALLYVVIGFSLAFYTARIVGNDEANAHVTVLGSLELQYSDVGGFQMMNAHPGDSRQSEFFVTNTGTLPVEGYKLYLSEVLNEYINDEIIYSVRCTSSDANPCQDVMPTPLPKTEQLLLQSGPIEPGVTHNYLLEVEFVETGKNQNYNQRKKFSFKILIEEYVERYKEGTLAARKSLSSNEMFWGYRDEITEIVIDANNPFEFGESIEKWDISARTDGGVYAHLVDDGLGAGTYRLFIRSSGNIFANQDSSYYFCGFSILTNIIGLNLIDTSNVTNMRGMLADNLLMTTFDLSNFNTSNVTVMSVMFSGNTSLELLDTSTFDVSNVVNMASMFQNTGLVTLDVSHFNSVNVTNMAQMFALNANLETIILDNFKTDSAETFQAMFARCEKLNIISFESFNSSKVTTMRDMFAGCEGLVNFTPTGLDTEGVEVMSSMFQECINLEFIDLSGFVTTNVTSLWQMFALCTKLNSVNLSSFDISNVTDLTAMFHSCSSLVNLDLSSFNFESVITMQGMFYNCSALEYVDLRNATFTTVTNNSVVFTLVKNGVNIFVKDAASKAYIENCLSWSSRTGIVTIYGA